MKHLGPMCYDAGMKKLSILLLFIAASAPAFAFQYDDGPKRGLWDTGLYLGFDLGFGGLKSEKSFADTDKKMDAIGGGFRIAGGLKLPFLRVGLEAGGAGASEKFDSEAAAGPFTRYENLYKFSSFHLMPQIFLELDWPGYIVPYAGYAIGVNFLYVGRETHVPMSFSDSEGKSERKTGIGKTDAIMLGIRGAMNPGMYYNLFWRKQDYGRVKISKDDSRLVGREIAMGLVLIF